MRPHLGARAARSYAGSHGGNHVLAQDPRAERIAGGEIVVAAGEDGDDHVQAGQDEYPLLSVPTAVRASIGPRGVGWHEYHQKYAYPNSPATKGVVGERSRAAERAKRKCRRVERSTQSAG